MKKLLSVFIALMLTLTMSAQTLDALWKEYDKAREADKPVTGLQVLRKIEKKAEAEKQYGHLMAALFSELGCQQEISPDSLTAAFKRIEERDNTPFLGDDVASWIYWVARNRLVKHTGDKLKLPAWLSQYKGFKGYVERNDGKNNSLVKFLLYPSVPELYAAVTKADGGLKYMPLVEKGVSSKYFNNDIISVIATELKDYEPLIAHYEKMGNRKAACIAAALYLEELFNEIGSSQKEKEAFIAKVDSYIEKYADLTECGKLAELKATALGLDMFERRDNVATTIAWIDEALRRWPEWQENAKLKNKREGLTFPMYGMTIIGGDIFHSSQELKCNFHSIRNIKELTIKAMPLKCSTAEFVKLVEKEAASGEENLAAILKKHIVADKTVSVTKKLSAHEEYEEFKDTISLGKLPLGLWVVEVLADGKKMSDDLQIVSVTDLKVIALAQREKQYRYAVVDSWSGQPVAGAKLHLGTEFDNMNEYTTDAKGEYVLTTSTKPTVVYATTARDDAQIIKRMRAYFLKGQQRTTVRTEIKLFTDRSIYRPGQTLNVSALAYTYDPTYETKVAEGKQIPLAIYDARNNKILTDTVTTDAFGVAAAELKLPMSCLNGLYSVRSNNSRASFRIEEYKRPTFEVSIAKPTMAYKQGDTISVVGTAKAYSGVPVANAKVAYSVRRNACWWWRAASDDFDNPVLLTDTIATDETGTFTLRMPMLLPDNKDNRKWWIPLFCDIKATAQVTDLAGETHEASLALSVGNCESVLSADLADKYLADSIIATTFARRNMSGNEIDGRVVVSIDGKEWKTVSANEKITFPSDLVSGKHSVVAICENDTVMKDIVVFRKSDVRPVVDTPLWFHQQGSNFSVDGKQVPWMQFGTSNRNVHVLYSLYAGDKMIESGTMEIDSAVVTKEFPYRKEYGDGINYVFAWVKNGEMQSRSVAFRRALPDKTLNMKWTTFRNRLVPGQQEEWRMSITDNTGKPANANLMAVLYDKSLDAISKHKWSFTDIRRVYQPQQSWHTVRSDYAALTGSDRSDHIEFKPLEFSGFNQKYFDMYYYGAKDEVLYASAPKMYKSMAAMSVGNSAKARSSAGMSIGGVYDSVESSSVLIGAMDVSDADTGGSGEEDIQVRENLSELAFFQPRIKTDGKGIATISFTLPESVTTWRFMGFANDKDMRFGMLTDEVVAQKKLMIQPRVPRFLREGDKVSLPATISNLTETEMNTVVKLVILDAETGQELLNNINKVRVKGGETAATTFVLDTEGQEGKVLVCRMTVEADGFSDGEQQYLPVLSTKEMVLDTYSYIMHEAGTKELMIADMVSDKAKEAQLTVEYTDAPEWLMVQALPYLTGTNDNNALSLAAAYYANNLAAHIAKSAPEIKEAVKQWGSEESALQSVLSKNDDLRMTLLSETPWMADAKGETEQKNMLYRLFDNDMLQYRNTNITQRLSELQNADGSWSWWKGMSGSRYMTLAVMETLLRLNAMAGAQKETTTLIKRAWNYLDKEIEKDLDQIKAARNKGQKPMLTYFQLHYLYCNVIGARKVSGLVGGNRNYLMNFVAKETKYDDMQSKAMFATIYAGFGKKDMAKELLESIRQHTVFREDMGRYFDSYQAGYSWFDYKIPTQVSVIEALKFAEPEDTKTIGEMQRWLLQSKRTQMWDTPLNAVTAIYAFFGNKAQLTNGQKADIKVDGKALGAIDATSVLGYEKCTKAVEPTDKTLAVTKNSTGDSWLNVYVKSLQATEDIAAKSNGITVTRQYDRSDLHVGDKVKVTITITADRDYDFVTVTDGRPACFEPVQQLSGYRNGCYQVMKDSQAQYHFDMLRKGTHTITTEYFVTQEGSFAVSPCRVQCAYAPEFSGRTAGGMVKSKK